jgi:hypothetical protein
VIQFSWPKFFVAIDRRAKSGRTRWNKVNF